MTTAINEGADAVQVFLTGAVADGEYQPRVADSLGGYRSSVAVESLVPLRSGGIGNLRIDRIGYGCAEGLGSIDIVSGGVVAPTIAWAPPGGTQGPAVAIANGATVMLNDGADSGAFVVVTRTSAAELVGHETVQLVPSYNNAVGQGDLDASGRPVSTHGIIFYNAKTSDPQPGGQTIHGPLQIWIQSEMPMVSTLTSWLPASGPGTLVKAGAFKGWPQCGTVRTHLSYSGNANVEYIGYDSRTDDQLNIPADGRNIFLALSEIEYRVSPHLHLCPLIEITEAWPWFPVTQPDSIEVIADESEDPVLAGRRKFYNATIPRWMIHDAADWIVETSISGWLDTYSLSDRINWYYGFEPGNIFGLWLKRTYTRFTNKAQQDVTIGFRFRLDPGPTAHMGPYGGDGLGETDGTWYTGYLRGLYRSPDAAGQYELYIGQDADPDLDAIPAAIGAALPLTSDPVTPEHDYTALVCYRNKYGLLGAPSTIWRRFIGAAGALQPAPHPPTTLQISPRGGGVMDVDGIYYPQLEGTALGDVVTLRAAWWKFWHRLDGSVPDPVNDSPTVTAMAGADSTFPSRFRYSSTALIEGQPYHCALATRRIDQVLTDPGPPKVYTAYNRDSVAITDADAAVRYVDMHARARAFQGRAHELHQDPGAFAGWTGFGQNLKWVQRKGVTECWYGPSDGPWPDLVFAAHYKTAAGNTSEDGFRTTFSTDQQPVESWGYVIGISLYEIPGPPWNGTRIFYLTAPYLYGASGITSLRVCKFDCVAKTISFARFNQGTPVPETFAPDYLSLYWGAVCCQVWVPELQEFRTAFNCDRLGAFNSKLAWQQFETDEECL